MLVSRRLAAYLRLLPQEPRREVAQALPAVMVADICAAASGLAAVCAGAGLAQQPSSHAGSHAESHGPGHLSHAQNHALASTLPPAMETMRAAAAPKLQALTADPLKSPGVVRGHMTHEHMDRRPWIAWLARVTAPYRRWSTMYANTTLLAIIAALLLLLFAYMTGRLGGQP